MHESDSLIACSASMAEEISELFGPGLAQINVIRNGIDSSRWPSRSDAPTTDRRNCSTSGAWSMRRASTIWIAALPRIRRTNPGTMLTVAGDGTQQDWLIEVARKHKVLKAVRFIGRADHDQLLELLHRTDVAVLPSHYEPFGIVALEAAAAGAPLVTTTAGGLGEAVIDGQTGLSCPPRDVPALAAAVRAALMIRPPQKAGRSPPGNGWTSDFDWQHRGRRDRPGVSGGQAQRARTAAAPGDRRTRPAGPLGGHPAPSRRKSAPRATLSCDFASARARGALATWKPSSCARCRPDARPVRHARRPRSSRASLRFLTTRAGEPTAIE